MHYLGMVLGIYAQLYAATQVQLEPMRVLWLTLTLLMSALLGPACCSSSRWRDYVADLPRIRRYDEGGASM